MIVLSVSVSSLENITTNLQQYLSMDDAKTSGTTAIDSTDTLNGTITGLITGGEGVNSQAYEWDTNTDLLNTNSYHNYNAGSLSVWFNSTSWANDPMILYKFGSGPQHGYIEWSTTLRYYEPGNKLAIDFGSPSTDAWYHLVLTTDGTTQKGYIDGEEVDTKISSVDLFTGDYDLILGHSSYGDFTGSMDEFAVWNRAITPSEVVYLYNSGAGNFYPFEEASTFSLNVMSIFSDPVTENVSTSMRFNVSWESHNITAISSKLFYNGSYRNASLILGSISLNSTLYEVNVTPPSFNDDNMTQSFHWNYTLTNSSTVQYYVTNNENHTVNWVYGSVPPVITTIYPLDMARYTVGLFNLSFSVVDPHLFAYNYTVLNSSGVVLYQNETTDLNVSSVTVTREVNLSYGNYTLNISTSDDHTFGSLHGLTYEVDWTGINFCRDVTCKKVWFGYYLNGGFHFLTSAIRDNYNISANIYLTSRNEYKFNMLFKKPVSNVKFGFAIPDLQGLYLRDASIGHFVWRDWYLDFQDLIWTGYNISYKKVVGYHLIYTDTSFCTLNVGEMCELDPSVGGLNIANTTITFEVYPVSNTSSSVTSSNNDVGSLSADSLDVLQSVSNVSVDDPVKKFFGLYAPVKIGFLPSWLKFKWFFKLNGDSIVGIYYYILILLALYFGFIKKY